MAIEIVDFPMKNGDFPWQNVSSPEGNICSIDAALLIDDYIIRGGIRGYVEIRPAQTPVKRTV